MQVSIDSTQVTESAQSADMQTRYIGVGAKFAKPLTDYEGYSAAAGWCNTTGRATITEREDCYEIVEIPEPPFEKLAVAKRREIWAAGDTILAKVKAGFTEAEIESWAKQERGAKDIQSGSADTEAAQFVAAIAEQRGIETDTLVEKILTNVAVYGALSSKVIGEQQRLDDLIKAAEATQDEKALAAVVWTMDPFAVNTHEDKGE